jgi:hypothetical protein
MDGTGNVMAVMDVMGHSKMDMTRLYQHPGWFENQHGCRLYNPISDCGYA